jgi:hypothetical protein
VVLSYGRLDKLLQSGQTRDCIPSDHRVILDATVQIIRFVHAGYRAHQSMAKV